MQGIYRDIQNLSFNPPKELFIHKLNKQVVSMNREHKAVIFMKEIFFFKSSVLLNVIVVISYKI